MRVHQRLKPGRAITLRFRAVLNANLAIGTRVTNTGTVAVQNPAPFASLNVGAATLNESPAGIAQLDPGQSVVFSWTYTALAAGPLQWTVTALGTDANALWTVSGTATGGFTVIAAAALSSTPTVVPAVPSIGQLVRYRLTVMNVGGVTANAVTPFGWITAGSGLTPVSSPVNPLTLSPLGSTVFEWTYTAIAATPTNLTATAYGTDANIGGLLATAASRHLSATELGLLALLEPILGPIWVWALMGEHPGATALAGGAIVLSAVIVNEAVALRRARRVSPPAGVPPLA